MLLDPDFEVWRLYGNRGWPGRFLFDRAGLLRDIHYGEGDYVAAERAIGACLAELDEDFEPPAPLEPLRPEDAEGALLEPQTADIALPADRERLQARARLARGRGLPRGRRRRRRRELHVQRRRGLRRPLGRGDVEPGLYETDGTVTADAPGLRLHGVQFAPLPPVPGSA